MLNKVRHRQETSLARPVWSWPKPILEVLWNVCDALREALAAHRHYERLRSRGVPHDTALSALRETLSGGHSACECHATDRGPCESAIKPVRDRALASIRALSYVK
jgi:hypothetical protein